MNTITLTNEEMEMVNGGVLPAIAIIKFGPPAAMAIAQGIKWGLISLGVGGGIGLATGNWQPL